MRYGDGPCSSIINKSSPVAQDRGGQSDTADSNGHQKVKNIIVAFLVWYFFSVKCFCPCVFYVTGISMLFETTLLLRQAWQGTHEDMVRLVGKVGVDKHMMSQSLRFCCFFLFSCSVPFLITPRRYEGEIYQMCCFVNLNQTYFNPVSAHFSVTSLSIL